MDYIKVLYSLALSFLGSVGFGMIFEVRKNRLLCVGIGGVICWGMYLFSRDVMGCDILISSLISSASTFTYVEIMSRILRIPTIILFTPSSVPLIPGGSLYYAMNAAVQKNLERTVMYGMQTLQCALGIALGISLVFAVCEMREKFKHIKK